jgi:hypothetical protein
MAKYEVNTKTFIAPFLLVEGQRITVADDFVPGPHLTPLDAAAERAMDKYYEANPGASLHPIMDLPSAGITVDSVPEARDRDLDLSLAEAVHSKPEDGERPPPPKGTSGVASPVTPPKPADDKK